MMYMVSDAMALDLARSIQHFKNEIQKRKERYPNSLELHGVKKQKAEIQQKIHANKKRFKKINATIEQVKYDLKNLIKLSKHGNDDQKAPYSDVWLKIVELKKSKMDLEIALKGLHKEQFKLKNKLKKIPHCD